MAARYLAEMLTPPVRDAQARQYGRAMLPDAAPLDALGGEEASFIAERDSFYLASIGGNGWPYVQHRGGPKGFLRVLDPHRLAFADLRGNRQLVTTGNVEGNDRVALFLMDYPQRVRLKLIGHAKIHDARVEAELADRVAPPELRRRVERVMVIDVVGFDWNCPAYITPRFTAQQVEAVVDPLRRRIAELEAALARG